MSAASSSHDRHVLRPCLFDDQLLLLSLLIFHDLNQRGWMSSLLFPTHLPNLQDVFGTEACTSCRPTEYRHERSACCRPTRSGHGVMALDYLGECNMNRMDFLGGQLGQLGQGFDAPGLDPISFDM